MIKRFSIFSGLAAFFLVVIIGFVNQLNWFTIFVRALFAFVLFYAGMSILGLIGVQSILQQELHKKERLEGHPPEDADKQPTQKD